MKNSYNAWISLLKIYMCFEVICFHFVPQSDTLLCRFISSQLRFAVPCFVFISFFLTSNLYFDMNIDKLKNRLFRLYKPMFIWTIICYILESIRVHELLSYKELFCTFIFGDSETGMCKQYWYIIASIIVTISIWIILNTTYSKYQSIVLILLTIFVFFFEYSGLNYEIFGQTNRMIEVLGKTIEIVPFATCGILFSKIVKNHNSRIYTVVLLTALATIYLFTKPIPANYILYGGFEFWTLSSIICIICIILPKIQYRFLSSLINKISSCTFGVYLIHQTLGRYLKMTNIIPYATVKFDLFVFVTALVITLLIKQLPARYSIV